MKIIVGRRWPLIAILFVIELVVIIGVSNLQFLPSELSTYENQYNNLAPVLNASASSQVSAIFANNFKVATVELIPALGLAVFGLSLYETARVVEAIGIIKGVGVGFALANLFFLPSTWLELPAYAIAAAESIYMVRYIYLGFKKGGGYFMRELRFFLVNLMLIGAVLIVAAVFEVSEIQIASGLAGGAFYALLTWIPFAVLFAGVVSYWRRARRDAPALEEQDAPRDASQVAGEQGEQQPQLYGEKDAAGGNPASSPSAEEGSGATTA